MDDMPRDPVSALAEAAGSLHELFNAYKDAGFTAHEALALVQTFLATSMQLPGTRGAV